MSMKIEKSPLTVVGSTEYVGIFDYKDIPAKIDTGADSSSVWASNITMRDDGTLVFTLFGEKSPYYDGRQIETTKYLARVVRSSHGDRQIRYLINLPLTIKGKPFNTSFTLANRVRNKFPILIGRKTLEGNFLVDVSRSAIARQQPSRSTHLNQELRQNPSSFHKKYIKQGSKEVYL